MDEPTVAELESLAQSYAVTLAPHLAFAVHQGDATQVAELLQPLDVVQLRTLAVVLAEQIPRPRSRPEDGVVDEIAVARAAEGEQVPLTRAERVAALQLMRLRGHTRAEISRRLRMSGATVKKLLEDAS